MIDLRFNTSEADQCFFIKGEEDEKLLVTHYVGDEIAAATHEEDSGNFIHQVIRKVKHVFRYVASSKQKRIIYKSDYTPGVLECFIYADFGGCMPLDRSTVEVNVMYAGGAIS